MLSKGPLLAVACCCALSIHIGNLFPVVLGFRPASCSAAPSRASVGSISSSRPDRNVRTPTTALSAFFRPNANSDDDDNNYGPAARYIPIDDIMLDHQFITCDPDGDFPCVSTNGDDDEDDRKYSTESLLVVGVPAVSPFLAFFSFEYFAKAYSAFSEMLSSNKWVAVDGGAYQAKIIAPAINGLVVPAIALLFATLTSTTITTLRQRQVDVRKAINMEAGELRAVECLLDAIDEGIVQDQCRDYVSGFHAQTHTSADELESNKTRSGRLFLDAF